MPAAHLGPVHLGPVLGLAGQVLLLALLAATTGLGGSGWVVGLAVGLVTLSALDHGLARRGAGLGPADRVTLTRATLVGAVAALVVHGYERPVPLGPLVALVVVALLLDGVDGWVARRTDTVSPLGARFDMEVDAFLILVLCVHVLPTVGAWVLAIGLARYAFVGVGWLLPWLAGPLPYRYWRKVVAATQGVVLAAVTAGALTGGWAVAALGLSLALLTESFGRDVWCLWTLRTAAPVRAATWFARPVRRAEHVGS